MHRTGRTVLAVTAGALALTLTGCGTSTQPVVQKAAELAPEAVLKLVGEKTSAAKSAKVAGSIRTSSGETTLAGAVSWANGLQGELAMDVKSGPMADSLAKAGGNGKMQARYLPDAMYMNMGDGMAANLLGKHWLKYAYQDLAKLMGASGEAMKNQFKSADPVMSVRALIASGKVTKVGSEAVDGVAATRYTGNLAATELAGAAVNGLTGEQTDALKQQFQAGGITTDHIDVWVSSDNLLVKKVEELQTKNGTLTSTNVYSDYGTPVTVQAPAADDTTDFAELINKAKQGTTS